MANEPYDANDEDQLDAGGGPPTAREAGDDRTEPYLDEHGVTTYHSQRKLRRDVADGLYNRTPNKLLKYDRAGTYYIVTSLEFERLYEYNGYLMSVGQPVRVPPGSRSLQTTSVRVGDRVIENVPVYRYDESTVDASQPETDPPITTAEPSTVTPPLAPTRNPHPTAEEVANDSGATINPVTGQSELPAPANALPSLESQTPTDANNPASQAQTANVTGPAPVTTPPATSSTPAPSTSASSSTSGSDAPVASSGPVYQYRPITQFADRYDFKTGKKIRE